ncbi:hypothetical protein T4C_10494 [Trichinella pseudospiralis]|uniref:Uncharacterized protein n=2 Tax=Trichinella pseudospiralis TaxID=6337 RepID=A0A0V1J151_TRIPS|nr:hypothetical protein T4C_10494 [Trichinella pseudospiralis]
MKCSLRLFTAFSNYESLFSIIEDIYKLNKRKSENAVGTNQITDTTTQNKRREEVNAISFVC